ncbi:hypothetical protein FOXYSP1_19198 [Fusarium oxysporum f. sp. phaseoli]
MKKLSDENFMYPAGTSVVSKQGGASDPVDALCRSKRYSEFGSSVKWAYLIGYSFIFPDFIAMYRPLESHFPENVG